ncbi:MAG: Tn7 transposase TnsA N-terminal domain-containing protein [Phormidium sp.]
MLSKEEITDWCDRLNLSEAAQNIIDRIRSSEPSRRVGGGSGNVSGRYPSRKMGVTIQFESHRVELPVIYQLEHDEDVLEFYDQPPQIKLDYQAKNGRKLGVLHTPDLFVIRTNSAGWEECKTEQDLKKHFLDLCRAISARYVDYRKTLRSQRIEQCCQEVMQVALEIYTEGEKPTRSKVASRLSKPAYFRDKNVCAALLTIQRQLGVED